MEFDEWEPIYEQILQDFGYDRGADVRARDVLAGYLDPFDLDRIDVRGAEVAIAGGSPDLEDEIDVAERADVIFAASTAADRLLEADVEVDVVFTDLDKNPETTIELSQAGTPVVVHAHGDNISALRRHLSDFAIENVLGTTQAAPAYPVENFGGFTDGDRAAFLADHLGAETLSFPGWDFDDDSVSTEKRRKLAWAERLLFYLQDRRDERFDILEDREVPFGLG